MGGTADEGRFIELIIANERVQRWLDEISKLSRGSKRLHPLLKEMADAVTSSEAYAEEARQCGAVPKLTTLMKRSDVYDDETTLDLISSIIAACSGPMATGDRLNTLCYHGIPITVKEGALGDGVGAKVWTVAHTLCQEMVENPEIVTGLRVLEIGAGCGPCGLLAAKLGAAEVIITDYVDTLLLNLRDALHLNGLDGGGGAAGAEQESEKVLVEGGKMINEMDGVYDTSWDPEEDGGSECSDLDAFFAAAVGGDGAGTAENGPPEAAWECGCVSVRFVDWTDSVAYMKSSRTSKLESKEQEIEQSQQESSSSTSGLNNNNNSSSSTSLTNPLDGVSTRGIAPSVPASYRFDLVLGTDVLYEWEMAESVAATVAHRLRPGGKAMIVNAVRDQEMFDAMVDNMRRQGLRVGVKAIEPRQEDGGVAPHDQEYEGGFVLVVAEHVDAPAESSWYRDDLFDSSEN